MWSLLFCISSTSILAAVMAARTRRQRRSNSAVEIGVFSRSDKAMELHSPGRGLAHDIDHAFGIVGEKFRHVAGERRHGAIFVALRIAAEMRKDRDVLGFPQRVVGRQRLLRK